MDNIVQCNDKTYDIDIITRVFERNMKQSVRSVHKFENVTNNSVYRIDTECSLTFLRFTNPDGRRMVIL